jgi:hypothetical protein
MALGATRDQAFLRGEGSPPPTIRPDVGYSNLGHAGLPYEEQVIAAHAQTPSLLYVGINPSIAKAYLIAPTNQGQRGGIAARQSMMYDPRNSPARSQMSEGYTDPAQVFRASNTWQTPSGLSSKGERERQPSTKAVSPFARVPIPTRMPWDL